MIRFVLVSAALLLLGCAPDDPTPSTEVPSWAKVAPEQIAEAKKHGVPVAFANDLGLRFVLIPAGTFVMGSPESEEGRSEDEKLQQVRISTPYYLQATEVTNQQLRAQLPGHSSDAFEGHSLSGPRQPAVNVSWKQAHEFAAWLSRQDGERRYALPTEEQWEFGWSGGAWPEDDGYRVTAAVASYRPNPWGLHDMHGNVFEYCADSSEDCGPWADGYSGPCYVVKGGSWREPPEGTRSAYRDSERSDRGLDSHGFRLVSPLPEEGEEEAGGL